MPFRSFNKMLDGFSSSCSFSPMNQFWPNRNGGPHGGSALWLGHAPFWSRFSCGNACGALLAHEFVFCVERKVVTKSIFDEICVFFLKSSSLSLRRHMKKKTTIIISNISVISTCKYYNFDVGMSGGIWLKRQEFNWLFTREKCTNTSCNSGLQGGELELLSK